jgi:8-hydroxy-5-deazaflavin:NADPH oxidoreductase
MDIGVLGTGTVGRTLAGKLAATGAQVVIGTRDPAALAGREEFAAWRASSPAVAVGTFAEAAAAAAEIAFNATSGHVSLEVLRMAGADNLDGKILVDVSNPLDFSTGMPPSLFVSNTDSLGERIQAQLPGVRVVKALNTINASVMVDPRQLADGDHHVFLSGNDAEAKQVVSDLLRDRFGWRHVIDLGDISTARGAEMLMPMWLCLMGSLGTARFSWRIVT